MAEPHRLPQREDPDVRQQVTISAEVTSTLSPETFAVAGPADPMLVVEKQHIPAVEEGRSVEPTGTTQESFSVAEVEESLGIDLDDELHADFEGQNHLTAARGRIDG